MDWLLRWLTQLNAHSCFCESDSTALAAGALHFTHPTFIKSWCTPQTNSNWWHQIPASQKEHRMSNRTESPNANARIIHPHLVSKDLLRLRMLIWNGKIRLRASAPTGSFPTTPTCSEKFPRIVFGFTWLTLKQCMQRSKMVHRVDNLSKHHIGSFIFSRSSCIRCRSCQLTCQAKPQLQGTRRPSLSSPHRRALHAFIRAQHCRLTNLWNRASN